MDSAIHNFNQVKLKAIILSGLHKRPFHSKTSCPGSNYEMPTSSLLYSSPLSMIPWRRNETKRSLSEIYYLLLTENHIKLTEFLTISEDIDSIDTILSFIRFAYLQA